MPVNRKLSYKTSILDCNEDATHSSLKRQPDLNWSFSSRNEQIGNDERAQDSASLKYPHRNIPNICSLDHFSEGSVLTLQRQDTNEQPTSVLEQQSTTRSVSHLVKGFEAKVGNHSYTENSSFLTPSCGPYEDSSGFDIEKGKRNASRRKFSARKRGRSSNDKNATVLQKLGITPFVGSDNRIEKRAFAHFDVQSVLFDIENASSLKILYGDRGNRPRNISTGASAASMRNNSKGTGDLSPVEKSKIPLLLDTGDGTSNDLVENCPFFRNEIGCSSSANESEKELLLQKLNRGIPMHVRKSVSKSRTPCLGLFHTTDNEMYQFCTGSSEIDQDQLKRLTLLESVEEESKLACWDKPKTVNEKRVFDFEHIDLGALYYKNYFAEKEHQNYMGIDDKYGPICLSIVRENIERMAVLGHSKELAKCGIIKYQYRIILRTVDLLTLRGTVLEDSIPSTSRHGTSRPLPARDIIEFCFPELQINCLKTAISGPKVPEHLQKLDEQQLSLQFKVGLLYCKAGQKSEEDMYNNEHHGPAFEEFMDMIGEKVFLKGFEGYRAQLDNKNDSTGSYSLYSKFQNREIMFHVSTLLPWTPNNKQQLLRKRHIGNDIVTVIFQEPGAEPFSPKNIRSHFQHVFIVVRVENGNTCNVTYRVAVSCSQDVPNFGPPIPPNSTFKHGKAFRDFLLCKVINAENAAHKSQKFTTMALRTRYEYLRDLATNCVTTQGIESGIPKFSKFYPMSLSVKKKDKSHPPCSPEVWCQGGLVWPVKVTIEDSMLPNKSFIAMSTQVISLIDASSKEVAAAVPCKSVIGWRCCGSSVRLYYDNGKDLNFTLEEIGDEIIFIINRLKAVTPGCQTQDMSLRRNVNGQLGFHIFYEGLVAEVEPYGMAWQAGLRKGSRLLEINNQLVGTMSHDHMIQALRKPGNTTVVVLPPLPDGQPRSYKSTSNLKRYSSMTSIYSERHLEPLDTSLYPPPVQRTTEFMTSVCVGEQGALVKALPRQAAPTLRKGTKSKHSARPVGFVFNSDQSSPSDIYLSSMDNSDGIMNYVNCGTNNSLVCDSSKIPRSKQTLLDDRMLKVSPVAVVASKLPSSFAVDPELTELEKSLADTRKSIDAKFYKSLMQNSIGNAEPSHMHDVNVDLNQGENGQSHSIDFSPCTTDISHMSPTHSAVETGKQQPLNNHCKSPPPYEVALTTLERHRGRKSTSNEIGRATAESDMRACVDTDCRSLFSPTGLCTPDSTIGDKPRYLARKASGSRRSIRSKVNSEHLEEFVPEGCPIYASPSYEFNGPPYEFIGNRNKLMVAQSESNISSDKSYSILANRDHVHSNRSIVHTRVRDVDDIIKEKIHIRSKSTDKVNELAPFLHIPQRSSSLDVDLREKSVHGNTLTSSVKASEQSIPWRLQSSSHNEVNIVSDKIRVSVQDEDLYHSTCDYPHTEKGNNCNNYSLQFASINDTFTKIDKAFGFTSYVKEHPVHKCKSQTDRLSTQNIQEAVSVTVIGDSCDIEKRNVLLLPTVSSAEDSAQSFSVQSCSNLSRSNDYSVEKKKSEAEESLEAAITEFHSTLSNIPTNHSVHTSTHPPEQLSTICSHISPTKYPCPRTPLPVKGYDQEQVETMTRKVRSGDGDWPRVKVNVSQNIASLPTKREKFVITNANRQLVHLHSRGYAVGRGRVQELVGKFSQTPDNDFDSFVSVRPGEHLRSHNETKVPVISGMTDSRHARFNVRDSNCIEKQCEDERDTQIQRLPQAIEIKALESPLKKKISVVVRPKHYMDAVSHLHIAPHSSPLGDCSEQVIDSHPGLGGILQSNVNRHGEN